MEPVAQDVPVTAMLAYQADNGGTTIHMVCLYREVQGYSGAAWSVRLVVYPRDGSDPVKTETWAVAEGQAAEPNEWVAMKPGEISRIDLVTDTGIRLLMYQAH